MYAVARTGLARWIAPLAAAGLLLAALLALVAGPASAATLTVCAEGGQYATIGAAVAAASPGDVIAICAGTYAENVDLAAMGSRGGGQGDITLRGMGAVTIAPAKGSGLLLRSDLTGDIVLQDLGATGVGDHAINFGRTINGSLTISGGSAANAGGAGLLAQAVTEGVVVRGASFTGNRGPGALITTQLANGGCGAAGAGGQPGESAGAAAITLLGASAEGNGGHGFVLDAAYGDIVIGGAQALDNGGDGFNISAGDTCAGSAVRIDGSRAEGNGDGFAGYGFRIGAANVRVAHTMAAANSEDGIRQDFSAAKVAPAVWALEVMSSTAAGNGRHGLSAGSIDVVTMTAVSAVGNRLTGILVPFTPLIGPGGSRAAAGAATFDQRAAIAGSLIMSNAVGIELFYEELKGLAQPLVATAATADIGGNTVCANGRAGLLAWGAADPRYVAAANYWGSFSGPFHATKNPGGEGDAVVDGASGSGGAGDVQVAPWISEGAMEVTPLVGVVGAQQVVSVTFAAGSGSGLRGGPGNPDDAPLFTVGTSSGILTTAYGSGPVAPAAIDAASGAITATLAPAASGLVTVTASGPCGLGAALPVLVAAPSLTITLDPPEQMVFGGSSASFAVAITNTGDITLTNVLVEDAAVPACARAVAELAPGAGVAYACQQPLPTITYTNRITVTANALNSLPEVVVSAAAAAQVSVVTEPTGLDPAPEPGGGRRLYLPAVRR